MGFKIINLKPFRVWKKRNKLGGPGHVPPASLMVFSAVSLWWHHRYAALLTSLMAKDCRYLLDSLLYNPELYPGNNEAFSNTRAYFCEEDDGLLLSVVPQGLPFLCLMSKSTACLVSVVENWRKCGKLLRCSFWLPGVSSGPSCNVELLQSLDALTERQRSWNLDYLTENLFLITLKNV